MSEHLTILHQIEKSGWLVSPIKGGSCLTHPQTRQTIFTSTTQHWLCLSMPIKTSSNSATSADRVALLRHLLQRNERMFMTKFSLDSDGSALLMVEMPIKEVSVPMLNKALGSFVRYSAISETQQETAIRRDRVHETSARASYADQGLTDPHSTDIEPGISKELFGRYMNALQGSGWWITKPLQGFPWHLGYKSILRLFETYFTISRNWVTFQIPLIYDQVETVLESNSQDQVLFMEYLLRLNDVWFMAKLGVNTNNQVLLLVEMPTETFNFAFLRFITRTISAYIDRYGQEIQIMAALQKDPRLSELLSY